MRLDPRISRVCAAVGIAGASSLLIFTPHVARATRNSNIATPGLDAFPRLHAAPERLRSARRSGAAEATRGRIRRMIAAADRIARLPYEYGGGHGSFDASGYDCSGSVSYVLHAGGLLATPEDSTDLESFGQPGPGRHVTIYANSGHAWMTIDGRRFDTNALQQSGTRWSSVISSSDGYVVRHPAGL